MPKISPAAYAARRQHIVEAARRCFTAKGIHISVDDVCEAAGVSKGAFYGYFKSKDALFVALGQAHGEMLETLPPLTERAALAAMLLDRTCATSPQFARIELDVWAYAMQRPDLRAILHRNGAKLREILRSSLAAAPLPADRAAALADFALGGMFMAIALGGEEAVPAVEQAIGDLLDLLGTRHETGS